MCFRISVAPRWCLDYSFRALRRRPSLWWTRCVQIKCRTWWLCTTRSTMPSESSTPMAYIRCQNDILLLIILLCDIDITFCSMHGLFGYVMSHYAMLILYHATFGYMSFVNLIFYYAILILYFAKWIVILAANVRHRPRLHAAKLSGLCSWPQSGSINFLS